MSAEEHRSTDTHLHTFQVQSNVNTSAFIVACHLCDVERADMLVCVRRSRAAFARCMCVLTNCFVTGMSLFVVSFRIQSSYSALQRINQDLEEKIHRDVSVFSPLSEPVRVSFSHKNSHACR